MHATIPALPVSQSRGSPEEKGQEGRTGLVMVVTVLFSCGPVCAVLYCTAQVPIVKTIIKVKRCCYP